jgi:GntR family transcriptional regulator
MGAEYQTDVSCRAKVTAVPIDLDEGSTSRFDDRALHRQLADVIRDAIRRGQLRPGETLPAEADISARTGLSRTTVREALDVLTGEGLVIKRSGAPTRVATPPPVRHMATSRYADELARLRALAGGDHPLTSAFTEDHGVDWEAYRVESTYIEDTATDDDAARLDIAPGTAVLRRQLIKYIADDPVQTQESVIPLALVAGTPVADPERQPWPGGTIAELFSVGLVVTRVVEEARARTPAPAERKQLRMEAAGPVWDIVRIFYVCGGDGAERPAEASTVVAPAARLVLRYDTGLR